MEQNELRILEEQCIQECAPACTAACPIHVDVRAMLLEFGRGDADAALKALKKTLPFPGIVGRICEHPCQTVCKRAEAGEAIVIARLERACANYGALKAEKARARVKRNRHVAVVGGGLSGATAAYDLARKGYAVTLYEALDPLGGSLWGYPEDLLPHRVIMDELDAIEALGVEIHLNTSVGGEHSLDIVRDEHEAVYLAIGAHTPENFGLDLDAHGRIQVDPITYATSRDGVFAGGSLLRSAEHHSAINSIADGRRAAISIDRYLQNVSLTASRTGEGAYASCLYTRTDSVVPMPVVPLADPDAGYRRDEAIREAQRCLQCECLECVKVCEYLAHYSRYPRKYVREVYNNLSIVKGTRYANQFINSCSVCGLCAEVCPTDLDMGVVVKQARQTMVGQGRMPPSAHDFALRDMAFSQSDKFALTRNAPGTVASDYVFFPGCQLSASSPGYVEKVYGYLAGALPAGTRVGLMLRCCGAPADWAGRAELFQSALADFRRQHQTLGYPRVVLACSSCYHVFKQNLPDVEIVSLWDLMVEKGLPAGTSPGAGRTVAIHDACTTRYETHLQNSVRSLLAGLGYQVEELPRSRARTTCCGYGGVQWLANPEVAQKVVERRIQESPADYVTYCAMCRDFLARRGKPTLHLLDLIYGADPEQQARRAGPGWSERHENRARLKRQLCSTIWGETMDGQEAYEAVKLIIDAEVRMRLEARLILVEDLQRVIEFAERTGRKLLKPETGHFLASYRPTSVTYWVEYTPEGDAFVVHNAYSHRMEIVDDARPGQGQ
jgi:NADPH-dependent glutamate synthase beta subunit-like oxidoreductase